MFRLNNSKLLRFTQSGSILLEVLLAFAILSLSLMALTSAASNAFRGFRVAQERLGAATLAPTLITEQMLTIDSLPSEANGNFGSYRWRLRAFPASRSSNLTESNDASVLAKLRLEIEWGEHSNPKRYTIETYRLVRPVDPHVQTS